MSKGQLQLQEQQSTECLLLAIALLEESDKYTTLHSTVELRNSIEELIRHRAESLGKVTQ